MKNLIILSVLGIGMFIMLGMLMSYSGCTFKPVMTLRGFTHEVVCR